MVAVGRGEENDAFPIADQRCGVQGLWNKTICYYSAYHPQANGLDERTNQTLKKRLAKLVNENQDNWDEFLEEVAYSMRTQKQSSTRFTPFRLMFGRDPKSVNEVY